ncbi:hypothetical protein Pelo_16584 [Pelomyxa schiedti]|nr:hypothetical protein Pelo_16584 [Pelomyxa schiedti]
MSRAIANTPRTLLRSSKTQFPVPKCLNFKGSVTAVLSQGAPRTKEHRVLEREIKESVGYFCIIRGLSVTCNFREGKILTATTLDLPITEILQLEQGNAGARQMNLTTTLKAMEIPQDPSRPDPDVKHCIARIHNGQLVFPKDALTDKVYTPSERVGNIGPNAKSTLCRFTCNPTATVVPSSPPLGATQAHASAVFAAGVRLVGLLLSYWKAPATTAQLPLSGGHFITPIHPSLPHLAITLPRLIEFFRDMHFCVDMSEVDEKPVLVAYNKITAEGFKEAQSTNNDETMARISKIPNWPRQWFDVFCVVGSLVERDETVPMCKILDEAVAYDPERICQDFQVWAETLTRELAIEQEFHAAGCPKMLETNEPIIVPATDGKFISSCPSTEGDTPKQLSSLIDILNGSAFTPEVKKRMAKGACIAGTTLGFALPVTLVIEGSGALIGFGLAGLTSMDVPRKSCLQLS